MNYIQRRDAYQLETVDEFESRREANAMLLNYQMSDPSATYYISSRSCTAWREAGAILSVSTRISCK